VDLDAALFGAVFVCAVFVCEDFVCEDLAGFVVAVFMARSLVVRPCRSVVRWLGANKAQIQRV
jgi:hypothetical protein